MAAVVGALRAELSASIAKFESDLGRAGGKVDQFGKRFDKLGGRFDAIGRRMQGLLAGFAGIAGVRGLGRLIESSLEAADSIGKTADAIGISTDALQEYRHAADLSGVSQENLDKSFKFFTKTLGEAKLETGELVTILKQYDAGLLETLRSQGSVEDKLQEAFRALDRTEDAFIRNALAAKLFGRGGVAMVNMVRSGADELERMRQAAHEAGIVLDEALIRKAEESTDRLTTLRKIISANATVIGVELAPVLIKITELTAEWAKGIGALVGVFARFERIDKMRALRGMVEDQRRRIDLLGELRREAEALGPGGESIMAPERRAAIERLREAIGLWQAEIEKAQAELFPGKPLKAAVETAAAGVEDKIDSAQAKREAAGKAFVADLERQNAALTLQLAGLDAEAELVEKIAAFEKTVARDILPDERATLESILGIRRELTGEAESQVEAEKRIAKALAETEALIERARAAARPAFVEIEETARRLAELVAKGDITAADRAALLSQMQAAASQLAPIVAEVEEKVRGLELAFMDVGDAAADALESFIFEGGKAIDVARSLAREIGRIGFSEFVRGPLRGGISDIFSGIFSLSQGLPFGATPVQGLPWLARAHGGPVTPGAAFLVGEEGPELFVPDRPGQVLAGAGGVTVNMTVVTPDADSFRRARSNLMAGAFRDAAREARRRN